MKLLRTISEYIKPTAPSRYAIIAHGHMFKNAGSTFDWALKNNFGRGFCNHRNDKKMIRGKAEYLANFLNNNKQIVAISSHHLCMPLPSIPKIRIIPAFIFRHPIERIRSVYLFERKQTEETPGSIHAKKYNFKDYVGWRMQSDVNATIRDFQVRFVNGIRQPKHIISQEETEKAKQTLLSCPLIGVVDRYNESMVIFEEYLKKYFPRINLAYIRQNVNQTNITMSIEEKKFNVLNDLEELGVTVQANNLADLEIYQFANALLDERCLTISNFSSKLEDFKERCYRLTHAND